LRIFPISRPSQRVEPFTGRLGHPT
jgi:hypothetical protein